MGELPKRIVSKAYVVEAQGAPFVLKDVVLDAVLPDEVLVEMKYTGICHTVSLNDLSFYESTVINRKW